MVTNGHPTTMTITASAAAAKSLQSCPTLGDPIDGSPLGSPFPGILQTRTLEWVAIAFSQLLAFHKYLLSIISEVQLEQHNSI